MSKLIIGFKEGNIEEWCNLGNIEADFDEKLFNIVSDVTKDTNLYQSNDTYTGGYGRIYTYEYDLDNSISEEKLNILKEKIEEDLIDVDSISLED